MTFARCVAVLVFACVPLLAAAQAPKLGAVIMHGKGGTPLEFVSDLADGLEAKGFLVANLEMPWSGTRTSVIDTPKAEKQIEAAAAGLKAKGATKLFVMGHSMGGVFALHYATRHPVDGVVAIAPGGTVGNKVVGRILRELPASVPVLWVSPTGDYPRLRRNSAANYAKLPKNRLHRFAEPNADHVGAPRASIPVILEWTAQVAAIR